MSLGYEVLRFVDRAYSDPASATDPRLLDRLAKYAREAFEGIVALHAPASPMTWETTVLMTGAVQTTARAAFRFPRPVEIVGFFPTVVPILPAAGGVTVPTTDSIAVQIDTDNQNYITSGDGISTNAGGSAGPFVTLSALSVSVPRVLGYKLRNPTPDIGFTYRWKLDVSTLTFRNSLVSMAIFARYL